MALRQRQTQIAQEYFEHQAAEDKQIKKIIDTPVKHPSKRRRREKITETTTKVEPDQAQ